MVCSATMAGFRTQHPFPEPPTIVLYHADCADGFGAAWAIWNQFPAARFIPVKHGNPPPIGLQDQRVVIVDFSYARETLETMAAQTQALLVLDHHITAEKALAGLPYAYFDLKKSGAVLAWEWAHDQPIPWLLNYIQDKDLWAWALPSSREINAAVASYPFDYHLWSQFKQKELEQEGRAILRYENELVNKLAAEAISVDFHGAVVPSVHSAILTSQIGERLSAEHPFCVMWRDRERMGLTWGPLLHPSAVEAIHTPQGFQSLSDLMAHCRITRPSLDRSSTVAVSRQSEGTMIPLHDDNPTKLTPVVTIGFIATCVLVFFYEASLPANSGER